MRSAVAEIVERQVDAGVDVVNDGEMSKPSYATYVKDRLGGFNGTSQPLTYQDLTEFPVLRDKVFGDPGRSRRKTPACTDDIVVLDHEAPRTDARNLIDALDGREGMGFLTAASPGVIALFFRNDHYATREEYLYAIADAMKEEYDAVAAAGLVLQLDCPDLAMGRHIQFAGDDLEGFRAHARENVQAMNHALRDIPPEQLRMHVCWGNYEGPHHHDVPFSDIVDIVFEARPAGISFEAANPRHAHEFAMFEDIQLPDGKVLDPRRPGVQGELHRASLSSSPSASSATRGSWVRRTSWRAAIAATGPGSGRRRWIPTWCGPSWPCSPRARASRRTAASREAGLSDIALTGWIAMCTLRTRGGGSAPARGAQAAGMRWGSGGALDVSATCL